MVENKWLFGAVLRINLISKKIIVAEKENAVHS